MDESESPQDVEKKESPGQFKKPVLIGRIGKLPKKAKAEVEKPVEEEKTETPEKTPDSKPKSESKSSLPPAVLLKELSTPIPYKEPKWSGLCPDGSDYGLEVLKSGMILERIDLTKQPYYVFGRLANCDVVMAHPTVSRHHATLQYKAFSEQGEQPSGWYLYDLGSTHGTFLNRDRLKANHYTRVRVGHQIRFGTSSRTYVMLGPEFDCEGESELSVTEIKQRALEMKLERGRMIEEAKQQREIDRVDEERRREEQGINWGMGEDAEDEPDLADNPYATTANEELYLEDPKKTLRGYFEREGHELSYDCEERGVGQFICKVELPMDDARGKPIIAEVIHKGKKKEAVIACALEACRVLDRAGLLRQSKHESRRRKQRDWSADDYYDSDDDNYLDRTGSVEKKRKQRMERHQGPDAKEVKAMTYDDLVKQVEEIEKKMAAEEKNLVHLRSSTASTKQTDGDDDALDAFMSTLSAQGSSMSHKADISNCKMRINKLKAELSKTQRLADIARPAHLPPLLKKGESSAVMKVSNSVVYGKRIRLKDDKVKKPKAKPETRQEETEFVEEVDSDDETDSTTVHTEEQKDSEEVQDVENTTEEKPEQRARKTETEVGGSSKSKREKSKVYGPMRPPENYVIPESYFEQQSDRDVAEIMED